MIYAGLLALMLTVTFLLQDWVVMAPGLFGQSAWGEGPAQGRLLLTLAFFFPACLTVPYPMMLALAFATGFLWDCRDALVWGGESPGFGAGPLLLGLVGSLVNGLRPFFREQRWVLVSLAAPVAVFLFLLFDYLWINFRAGEFAFPPGLWAKLFFTSFYTGLAAAFFLFLLVRGLRATGHGGVFLTEH